MNSEKQLTCLQVHNDYQIKGGETKTAELIAKLLEEKGIKVIKYYKNNNSFADASVTRKFVIGVKSIYNLDTVSEVEKILKENKVDFALVHNTMPIISNSIYHVLMKNRIPVIKYLQNYNLVCLNGALDKGDKCITCQRNCFRGVEYSCYKNSRAYSFVKYLAKIIMDRLYLEKIDAFMPNSSYVMNMHVQMGIDRAKMHVMMNYISGEGLDYECSRSSYLYFGRISKEKGILTVIKAFSKRPDLRLRIVGSGDYEEEVKQFISAANIKNVDLVGPKYGDELRKEIYEAKFVIVPSEWDEPLPRTILESYLEGTPVIGSNRGGIPEMIKEGNTGYVFEAGDSYSLGKILATIDNLDEDNYYKLRKKAASEIPLEYSKDCYFERFINCVNEIVN